MTRGVIWVEWRNLAFSTDRNHFQKWLKVYAFLQWWIIPRQRAEEACQNLVVAWAEWQRIPEESRPQFSLATNTTPKHFFNLAKKKFPHLNKPDPRKTGYRGKGDKNENAPAPSGSQNQGGKKSLGEPKPRGRPITDVNVITEDDKAKMRAWELNAAAGKRDREDKAR